VLAIDWYPQSLPTDATINLHTLIAHDGEVSRATLYERAGARSVICLMHPRQDMTRHPAIPALLQNGHSVWAQTGRNVGNDLTLVHESALLDVAAGVERLREQGYEQIVLVGISGGAGLGGFGRLTTPEAWLSTWSGITSNASLERSLRGVTVPTLLIEYTGDCSVFPSDVAQALEALAAEDVTHQQIRANHFGGPIRRGEEPGIPATVAELTGWAGERFATR
jgi:pimeloyl-ACP methyl ester carboxylesterase